MNYIPILEPLWSSGIHGVKDSFNIYVASWKVGSINQIVIEHHDYEYPYYITGHQIREYPTTEVITKRGDIAKMYVVPIRDLSTDLLLQAL